MTRWSHSAPSYDHPRRRHPGESQRLLLRRWRIRAAQMGFDLGEKGTKDHEVLRLLLQLRRPTWFTRDIGFYSPRHAHPRYALVLLDVRDNEVALFVRRFLRHPDFDTERKRMGQVARVSRWGIHYWRTNVPLEMLVGWPAP